VELHRLWLAEALQPSNCVRQEGQAGPVVDTLTYVCWCVRCVACMQVVPDKIGDKNSSYNDFICALPDNQCRYAGVCLKNSAAM
jgi:hypothetical protein